MSGSRRSRFQGVLEPRDPSSSHPSHHQHHQHHQHQRHPHQLQRPRRNPWVAHESHSTSSSSGRTHHKTRPMEASAPLHMDHSAAPRFLQPTFYGQPTSSTIAHPLPLDRPLLPQHQPIPSLVPTRSHTIAHHADTASTGSPPTAPGSSNSRCDGAGDVGVGAGESTSGGWSGGGCGGQCPALDDFCFHCLRVAFIAGAATGVGLVVAGAILRLHLMVLVYIGGLTAIVSLILLGVHCCVRRDDAIRRRRLRELQKRRRGRDGWRNGEEGGDGDYTGGQEGIPLREMGPMLHHLQHNPSRVGSTVGTAPMYHGLVLQPPPPPAAFRPQIVLEPNIGGPNEELEIISQTGMSVWRQNELNRAEIAESHH